MKQSKKVAWNLAKDMSLEELADKSKVTKKLIFMAEASEEFRDSLVEVGIKEIAKQGKRFAQGFEARTKEIVKQCGKLAQGGEACAAGQEEDAETWTLQEVQDIVDLVRAGKSVQVAPYDPDSDDDPYVFRQRW